MSLLVEGGRIVTGSDDYVADVYIEDETITMIGESLDVEADRVIDAEGMYLLPGCIDPHTHLDMPFGGTVTIDDFLSGQLSAAFGGTTCHIDFATQSRGQSIAAAIEEWHGRRKTGPSSITAFTSSSPTSTASRSMSLPRCLTPESRPSSS